MRTLLLASKKSDATSFYRCAGVAKDLQNKGADVIVGEIAGMPTWADMRQYDAIMIQRPSNPSMPPFIDALKKLGIKIWVEYDDNLLAVPESNPYYGNYATEESHETIKSCLAMADVVSVTTEALKEAYLPYNKNIVVIPNAFPDFIKREKIKRNDIVLWRGTNTHALDIMQYAKELDKLTEFHKEITFAYMGFSPYMLKKSTNRVFVMGQDTIEYFYAIQRIAPMVMQVPLFDDAFNRAKSNIAMLEGIYAGAVAVVPYWWDGEGVLKYRSEREFYEAIRAVLKKDVDIEKLNDEAWTWVQDNRMLSKVNEMRIELIKNL